MRRLYVVFAALMGSSILASVALAAGSTAQAGYGGTPGAAGTSPGGAASGSLPFTGMDLALVLVAGVILIASGVLLRRRGSNQS